MPFTLLTGSPLKMLANVPVPELGPPLPGPAVWFCAFVVGAGEENTSWPASIYAVGL
jgi:hypothetical protein